MCVIQQKSIIPSQKQPDFFVKELYTHIYMYTQIVYTYTHVYIDYEMCW